MITVQFPDRLGDKVKFERLMGVGHANADDRQEPLENRTTVRKDERSATLKTYDNPRTSRPGLGVTRPPARCAVTYRTSLVEAVDSVEGADGEPKPSCLGCSHL